MLLLVSGFDYARDGERLADAMRAHDPAALVCPARAPGNVRVVARLDARRTLAALAAAGFAAVPEWQLGA
jgi:hypothetical protein